MLLAPWFLGSGGTLLVGGGRGRGGALLMALVGDLLG
jgi:hypothetical protein